MSCQEYEDASPEKLTGSARLSSLFDLKPAYIHAPGKLIEDAT